MSSNPNGIKNTKTFSGSTDAFFSFAVSCSSVNIQMIIVYIKHMLLYLQELFLVLILIFLNDVVFSLMSRKTFSLMNQFMAAVLSAQHTHDPY